MDIVQWCVSVLRSTIYVLILFMDIFGLIPYFILLMKLISSIMYRTVLHLLCVCKIWIGNFLMRSVSVLLITSLKLVLQLD